MQDVDQTILEEGSNPSLRHQLIHARNHSYALLLIFMVGWTGIAWFTRQFHDSDQNELPREFVVDLNHATEAELNLLPGVGPKLAQEIVRFREDRGGFHSVEDLMNIRGIKDGRISALRKHLRVTQMESMNR
ncbi:MAG: helix-hairpin-helix domain-containing protein [Pirellula sp.]